MTISDSFLKDDFCQQFSPTKKFYTDLATHSPDQVKYINSLGSDSATQILTPDDPSSDPRVSSMAVIGTRKAFAHESHPTKRPLDQLEEESQASQKEAQNSREKRAEKLHKARNDAEASSTLIDSVASVASVNSADSAASANSTASVASAAQAAQTAQYLATIGSSVEELTQIAKNLNTPLESLVIMLKSNLVGIYQLRHPEDAIDAAGRSRRHRRREPTPPTPVYPASPKRTQPYPDISLPPSLSKVFPSDKSIKSLFSNLRKCRKGLVQKDRNFAHDKGGNLCPFFQINIGQDFLFYEQSEPSSPSFHIFNKQTCSITSYIFASDTWVEKGTIFTQNQMAGLEGAITVESLVLEPRFFRTLKPLPSQPQLTVCESSEVGRYLKSAEIIDIEADTVLDSYTGPIQPSTEENPVITAYSQNISDNPTEAILACSPDVLTYQTKGNALAALNLFNEGLPSPFHANKLPWANTAGDLQMPEDGCMSQRQYNELSDSIMNSLDSIGQSAKTSKDEGKPFLSWLWRSLHEIHLLFNDSYLEKIKTDFLPEYGVDVPLTAAHLPTWSDTDSNNAIFKSDPKVLYTWVETTRQISYDEELKIEYQDPIVSLIDVVTDEEDKIPPALTPNLKTFLEGVGLVSLRDTDERKPEASMLAQLSDDFILRMYWVTQAVKSFITQEDPRFFQNSKTLSEDLSTCRVLLSDIQASAQKMADEANDADTATPMPDQVSTESAGSDETTGAITWDPYEYPTIFGDPEADTFEPLRGLCPTPEGLIYVDEAFSANTPLIMKEHSVPESRRIFYEICGNKPSLKQRFIIQCDDDTFTYFTEETPKSKNGLSFTVYRLDEGRPAQIVYTQEKSQNSNIPLPFDTDNLALMESQLIKNAETLTVTVSEAPGAKHIAKMLNHICCVEGYFTANTSLNQITLDPSKLNKIQKQTLSLLLGTFSASITEEDEDHRYQESPLGSFFTKMPATDLETKEYYCSLSLGLIQGFLKPDLLTSGVLKQDCLDSIKKTLTSFSKGECPEKLTATQGKIVAALFNDSSASSTEDAMGTDDISALSVFQRAAENLLSS